MTGEDQCPITLKLVRIEEKKEFLALLMNHKMEMVSNGIEIVEPGGEDQLSKFWDDSNSNYLLWINDGSRRVGFTAVHIEDTEDASLLDIEIFRNERGRGNGKRALEEVCKFVRYRGLKKMRVELFKAPDRTRKFFTGSGFSDKDLELKMNL